MSSSQVSSDDFPRLVGAENFDVWKTRVCAALDGKHVLGYVMKPDYDGVSEDESDESESDMSDVDEARKAKPAEKADVDSDAVDTRTIPIEGIGRIELAVVDAKGNEKNLILHGVQYAPQLQFCLLSVPAAVKQDYRFSFDRKHCVVQTDQRFKFKAPMAANTDLYPFQAQTAAKATALVVSGAKPSMDPTTLRMYTVVISSSA
ncbi:hypothetical protein PC110_g1492 [Phytophthora cactorum]|uniref:Retrovirus-related Pol polyprotein from transposon TNT 1-94-like beta-barrel domain-containing protein n=1 Tax=Phytophthora cactorum TaxID=29920 RepID=A0A329T355_9STRA|nr:hypothetical protein PC110_g1492 [Phytophthora cactorum]